MHLCLLLMRFGFQAAPWMLEAKPISLCHVAKGWDDMDDHINDKGVMVFSPQLSSGRIHTCNKKESKIQQANSPVERDGSEKKKKKRVFVLGLNNSKESEREN
ncbi:SEC12-like protein 2 [Gossypium australe]|uniref:SEC12-like protein 2 n=1 Tax=Gossypium australe TaxID=47621 RepID=A0A5B6V3G9_9ROSI|nr:SEC12-like protein 2 [Gossypium australe]